MVISSFIGAQASSSASNGGNGIEQEADDCNEAADVEYSAAGRSRDGIETTSNTFQYNAPDFTVGKE